MLLLMIWSCVLIFKQKSVPVQLDKFYDKRMLFVYIWDKLLLFSSYLKQ